MDNKVCNMFHYGCSWLTPDANTVKVTNDGHTGYQVVNCPAFRDGNKLCGWYPIHP